MKKTMKQIDMFETTAKAERDQALEQVKENSGDWFPYAIGILPYLDLPLEFTGEKLRHIVTEAIGPPHHHNAWGALVRTARKRKLIFHTGIYVQMEDPQSHARTNPVYRRNW